MQQEKLTVLDREGGAVWFGDINRLGVRQYCFRVFIIGTLTWLYWESLNSIEFYWWSIDGYPTYVAAKLWLSGKLDAIYQLALWVPDGGHREWKRALNSLGIPNAGTSFVYHPTYLMLTAPVVAILSVDQFIYTQLGVNALATGIVVMELLRISGAADESRKKLAALFSVISFPGMYSAYLGQNVLPLLALILLSWRFLELRCNVLACVLGVIAVAMKAWVAPVVILAIAMHGIRACMVGATAAGLVLVVLPVLLVPELISDYIDVVARLTSITVYPYNNVSLRVGIARLSNPDWIVDVYRWLPVSVPRSVRGIELSIVAAIYTIAAAAWYRKRPSPAATFVAALSLLLLMPSVCWTHYLVLVMPACVWLLSCTDGRASVVGFVGLLLLAIPWHPFPGSIIPREPFVNFVADYPALLALGLLLPACLIAFLGLLVLMVKPRSAALSNECQSGFREDFNGC